MEARSENGRELRGNERIQDLEAAFPFIPRSIILKTDLLREGIRYTPLLHQIGEWAIAEFLLWGAQDEQNPQSSSEGFVLSPWKLNLSDGTPVKLISNPRSSYEVIRIEDGKFALTRDGERLDEVWFETRPRWPFQLAGNGTIMASVFQLESPNCLIGCLLRHCEYRSASEACRYCCLESVISKARSSGIPVTLSMDPDDAVEAYRAALSEADIHTLVLTGGSIHDEKKEAQSYAKIYSRLAGVREKVGASTVFRANPSCFGPDENKRLQDAAVDVVCIDMEVWDDDLRPFICPGKEKHIPKRVFMERIVKAVEIFGPGNVQSNFVQGVTMVCPESSKSEEESMKAELEGYEWCLQNGVYPMTSQWLSLPGTAYYGLPQPRTEYFLAVGYEKHRLLEKHDAQFPYKLIRGHCARCGHSWTDDDYFFKVHLKGRGTPTLEAEP